MDDLENVDDLFRVDHVVLIRVLVLGEDRSLAQAVEESLQPHAVFRVSRPSISHVRSLDEAEACLASQDYDVALVWLEAEALDAAAAGVARLCRVGRGASIVVLPGRGGPERASGLLRAGAADVLRADDLTPPVLARVIRHAVVRRRVRDWVGQSRHELRRLRSDLTEFAQVLAQDLKTPLAVVRMEIEAAARAVRGGELMGRAGEAMAEAHREIDRAATLIDNLIHYTRLGTRSAAFESLDLQHTIHQAIDRVLANALGAQVSEDSFSMAEDLPRVFGLQNRLIELFEQLFTNALANRGAALPLIRIDAHPSGKCVEVSVTDNGLGIPENEQKRVMGIFQRVNDRTPTGSGIGLAIAHRIVDLHGGTLRFTSALDPATGEPRQLGVTCTFSLPAVRAGLDGSEAASPRPSSD